MPQSFFKRCICHGKGALIPKKGWKAMRKSKAQMVCLSGVLESGVIVMPYIPLLEPVSFK
jgi:hypothetical protein